MPELEIGISLPTLTEIENPDIGCRGAAAIGAAARHIEELGLESVWAPDLIVGDGTPSLESMVVLTAAASVTNRLRVGFGVLVLPLRPVVWMAAQVAALQHLSGSRVILGVGSGGFPGTPFWQAVGVAARDRARRTDLALDALPRLIAGEPTRLTDEPHQPVVTLAPAAPVPPILIGGNSRVAIRRAIEGGHGWFPSLIAPDALATGVARLRELASRHGRPAPQVTVGGHAMLGSEEAVEPAREEFVRRLVELHGIPPEQAAMIPVAGSPAEVAERLSAYAAGGANRLVLSLDGGGWLRQAELIAEARALLE